MRLKDLLTQQSSLKELHETKPNDMKYTDWAYMKEKVAGLIHLYVSDEMMYHILDLTTSKKVWDKLDS